MAFHMEQLAQDLMLQGMSPEEARREARRRFGVAEQVHERSRRARGVAVFDEAGRNVRFALRSMRRTPLLTGAFVLTLALCIGFGTAVFSAVNEVLWKPLPYPDADRLALAGVYNPEVDELSGHVGVDGTSWIQIRDEAQGFETAVYSAWIKGVNLTADNAARFVQQQRVSAGFFGTLGVEPFMGRGFDAQEDLPEGSPVAILAYDLWQNTFGGDPDILGSSVRLKGELHTVVGIMPPDFQADGNAEVWTPLRASTTGEGGGVNYTALVRLPQGMSWEEAQARFDAIPVPTTGDEPSNLRFGLVALSEAQAGGLQLPMLILLGAVGLMILVGCANLAGIQVSRGLARETEMATRKALGSGTGALVRQLVTENVLLGLLGGALGLGVAVLSMDGLEGLFRTNIGLDMALTLEGRALLAALALTGAATVLFGLAPLWQLSRSDALRVLVSGTRSVTGGGSRRLRRLLLVGEVAMVTVLLFAAVLLARSYGHLAKLEPGFDPVGVSTVQLSLDDARFAEPEAVEALFNRTLEDLEALSGVQGAAVTLSLPYERPLNMPFRLDGDQQGDRPRLTNLVYVTPEFFDVMGIPVLDGRGIEEWDRADSRPIVVANQALVDAHFQDRQVLGSPVNLGGGDPTELVGVVGNVQQGTGGWGSAQPVWAAPTLYVPVTQLGGPILQQVHVWFSPSWVIRAPGASPQLLSQIARVFEAGDSELPVARAALLEDIMAQAFSRTRFQAVFLLVVAGFALLLAGVGLYGIVAQEVLERRREMGVRMALGSTPGEAIWTTGMSGIRLAAWGLLAGAVAAYGAGKVLSSLIWGVTPGDPVTILALMGGIGGLALLASFVPALRMGRLDPARVLRE
jgi:predicted permease